MGKKEAVRRFEGEEAARELLRQMKIPDGQRPRIRIVSKALCDEKFVTEEVIVRNHVPKRADKPFAHSIFHVADLLKSKNGQPLPIRFVWPPEHADPQGKDLYPLKAVEVLAS